MKIFFLLFLIPIFGYSQFDSPGGLTCETSGPICYDSLGTYSFPNSYETSIDLGDIACLGSSPDPSWFYLKIDQSGDLLFQINQWEDLNGNGINDDGDYSGLDVDFVAWGPFTTEIGDCDNLDYTCEPGYGLYGGTCPNNTFDPSYYNIDTSNILDCSYDSATTETLTINGAQSGEFYVILITNFSEEQGLIEIIQTNLGAPGTGSTDCSIINANGILGADIVFCESGTASLNANPNNNTTFVNYIWEYDDGTGYEPILGTDGLATIDVALEGTYKVTITDNSGNSDSDEIEISIFNTLTASQIPNQLICDDNNDGFWEFDLNALDTVVLGDIDATEFNVSYHTNQMDADTNNAPLSSPYNNIAAYQAETIYVRIENSAYPDCFVATNSFSIEVFDSPNPALASSIPDIEICDNTSVGSNTDGFVVFDLTQRETDILNGQSASDFSLSYYMDNAYSSTSQITNLNTFINTVAGGQPIYVRMSNVLNPDCYTDTSFEVKVLSNPSLQPPDVIQICNTQLVTDYDLTIRKNQITRGDASITLIYYEDAALSIPILNPISFTSTTLLNTVYIRAISTNGCESFSQLNLETTIYDTFNDNPTAIEKCDADNDGREIFDLTQVEDDLLFLLDGNTTNDLNPDDYQFRYYRNEFEAYLEPEDTSLSIENPAEYTNVMSPQTIYVRIIMTDNNCLKVVPFEIIINPPPSIFTEDQYVICLNPSNTLIPNNFNTTLPYPPINTQLDADLYSFQWYAGTEQEVIDNPSATLLQGETAPTYTPTEGGYYTVTATNNTTGCSFSSTTLVVESYPPESVTVNLTSNAFADNNVIEVIVEGNGTYEYRLEYTTWQDRNIFENVPSGERIVYVRDTYNCDELIAVKMIIDYPKFFTPNGDGYNDTWNIFDLHKQQGAEIIIFDRYGKFITQLRPFSEGWDGRYNGLPMPTSDYWFTVEYIEPNDTPDANTKKIFKTHFSLKR